MKMGKRKFKRSNSRFGFANENNIFSKPKRSQGHVEIIISFALFVGVLVFIFFFMNPFAKTQEKTSFLENVKTGFLDNVSGEIGKISVIVGGVGECYDLNEVKKYGTHNIEVYNPQTPRRYTIYYHEFFGAAQPPSCGVNLNYKLGVYSEEEMLIYERVVALKNLYEQSPETYKNVKKSLRTTDDFLFAFKDSNGNEMPQLSIQRRIPVGIDVEASQFPVRVINKSGDIKELVLNIRAW
jgi:hypothetical protein